MPDIVPVSELRNYGSVLEKVKINNPVYLTKNGYGTYVIRDIAEDEAIQQELERLHLLEQLLHGIESYEKEGGLTVEEIVERLRDKGVNIDL